MRQLSVQKNDRFSRPLVDAHDLHSKTLIGLKRLIEVVRESGTLSRRRLVVRGTGWFADTTARFLLLPFPLALPLNNYRIVTSC